MTVQNQSVLISTSACCFTLYSFGVGNSFLRELKISIQYFVMKFAARNRCFQRSIIAAIVLYGILILTLYRQDVLIKRKNVMITKLRKSLWLASGTLSPSMGSLSLPPPSKTWSTDHIPKLIHQMAADVSPSSWPTNWKVCQNSWKQNFPEFEYRIWNDTDIDIFFKNRFPQYYPTFIGYPHQINRVDMARYFILYEYGGIYADMDILCLRNFYNLLPHGKVSIAESPWEQEDFQNALMTSPPRHPYWHYVIAELLAQSSRVPTDRFRGVVSMTGPAILSSIASIIPEGMFNPLPSSEFSPPIGNYTKNALKAMETSGRVYSVHLGTCSWCDPSERLTNHQD